MATYAAFKHVELYNVGNAKKRVLKPPGGGSSDLFGADNQPETPRSMNKNRMQSNIFAAPDAQKAGNGETPRRGAAGQDSHNRLFGEVDRPYTPAKNHMKSNLPIGATDAVDNGHKSNGHSNGTNGKANGHHQNGNGVAHTNGHSSSSNGSTNGTANGHSNGTSSALSQNGSSHSNEDATPDSAYSSHSNSGVAAGLSSSSLAGLLGSPSRRGGHNHQHHQFYPSGEALNPTYASNINLCISDDIIISVTDHDDRSEARFNTPNTIHTSATTTTNTTLLASPKSSSSHASTPRSPRFAQRNPVTGRGVEDCSDMPRKPSSRGGNLESGNPVTGEGYKSGGAAEINTTVPSLNSGGHVINKNRIPPGGFSSGLW